MAIPVEPARIFVADTDSSILELMQDLLQDDGYSVTVLQCATHAYEEIRQTLPDLVILDITLERPGDGWLILDQLRHHAQTSQVPVIICSADVRELRVRQDDLGGRGCVAVEKPFDIDTLLTAIREGLAVKRQAKTLTAQHKETYRDLHVPDGVCAAVPGSAGMARTQAPQGVQSGSAGGSEPGAMVPTALCRPRRFSTWGRGGSLRQGAGRISAGPGQTPARQAGCGERLPEAASRRSPSGTTVVPPEPLSNGTFGSVRPLKGCR